MSFFKGFMLPLFLLGFTGCVSSSPVEGIVISSREVGQGVMEHLVQTNRSDLPYYILRVNNNTFRQGSKVILEGFQDSGTQRLY
jgi:hypothetical protein